MLQVVLEVMAGLLAAVGIYEAVALLTQRLKKKHYDLIEKRLRNLSAGGEGASASDASAEER